VRAGREQPLEPGPPLSGAVEDPGVGELELAEGELVAVAAAAVLGAEGRGKERQPAAQEALDLAGRERARDLGQGLRVGARAEAVVERLEREPAPLGLTLGPLVAVEVEPDREGRVGERLDEGGAEVAIADVEVVVIGQRRLASELEVGVAVGAALAPAAPDQRALLLDADQHHPEAALALGALEVGSRHRLLRIAAAEAHDRDPLLAREAVDPLHVAAADPAQQRRGGDRVAAVEQEADHLSLSHQLGHVALEEDAVHGADLERHVLAE
jgi:hypothetical protein